MLAAVRGHVDCVRLLVESGAKLDANNKDVCNHGQDLAFAVFESVCWIRMRLQVSAISVLFRSSGLRVLFLSKV